MNSQKKKKKEFSFAVHSHKLTSCMIWNKNSNYLFIIVCALEILFIFFSRETLSDIYFILLSIQTNKIEDQRSNLAKLTQQVNIKAMS